MHHKHVFDEKAQASTLNYDTFVKHDTIIIKSCTGTGKTTAVARHAKRYIEQNPKTKLLTITTRTTLSDQHQLSFSETNMKHYKTTKGPLHREKSLTICINSLRKINLLEASDLNEYIVYIDEVASFLELTHNDTTNATLKETFYYIANIIKHAKKVIVSDALINDNVFYFLRHRTDAKTIFVENSFKKFQSVKAVRVRDEQKFLDSLIEHCRNEVFFLFGCDSETVVSKLYQKCLESCPEKKHLFKLITAKTDTTITDASEEFKNHFCLLYTS